MKDMRGVRGEWDIVALGMTTGDLVYDPGSLLLLRSGPPVYWAGWQAEREDLRHRGRFSAQILKHTWLKCLRALHGRVEKRLYYRPLVLAGPNGSQKMGKKGGYQQQAHSPFGSFQMLILLMVLPLFHRLNFTEFKLFFFFFLFYCCFFSSFFKWGVHSLLLLFIK